MSPKKRKSKKKRTQERQQFLKKSCPQLIFLGDEALEKSDYREAIQCFQTALKHPDAGQTTNQIQVKLFQAYFHRAEELHGKLMTKEALTMESQALAAIRNIADLSVSDMACYLTLCRDIDAFAAYRDYVNVNGTAPEIETVLADIFIKSRKWNFEKQLPPDAALKRDFPIFKKAIPLMDKGEWQEAWVAMRSLPRSSPFSHLRLFCRAMISFYEGNESDLKKAASLIPPRSILKKIVDTLIISADAVEKGENPMTGVRGDAVRLIRQVWDGPYDIQKHVNTLIKFDKKRSFNAGMGNAIKQIAKQLSPKNPEWAAIHIIETVMNVHHYDDETFYRMARKVIGDHLEALKSKLAILIMDAPFEAAVSLFDYFDRHFTDPEEAAIAKGIIIHQVALDIQTNSQRISLPDDPDFMEEHFGITTTYDKGLALQLIEFGIKIDPRNKALYDLAGKIRVYTRDEKKVMESILTTMALTWPTDPEPCLRLASLYHSKGAYRKAETILKKATALAPHDSRVSDLQVISLLIAAERNADNKKFHLVWPDMEKAAQIDSPKCRIILDERSILLKGLETGELDADTIDKTLKPYAPSDQLKLLLLLHHEIDKKTLDKRHGSFKNKLKNAINLHSTHYFELIDGLSALEALQLLRPLPDEWQNLISSYAPFDYIPGGSKRILAKLDDAHLFSLIHNGENPSGFAPLIDEISRRTQKKLPKKSTPKEKSDRVLLEFYELTLENLDYAPFDLIDLVDEYEALLDKIDPETEKRLKSAAEKLARLTHGPLKMALDRFDFDILDPPPFNPFFDPFDDDDWDDDDDDWDDDEMDDGAFFNALFDDDFPSPFDFDKPKSKSKKKGKREHQQQSLFPDDPFSGSFGPGSIDEEMITALFNTPMGKDLKKILDGALDFFEMYVDEERLRGKSDAILKKAKKRIPKDKDMTMAIDFVNEFYKKEAKAKLSREAKTLFLQ